MFFFHANFQTCIFTSTLEGYRKDTGRLTDPLTDPLTDLLRDPLTDPLTDHNRPVNRALNSSAQTRKQRQAWRLGPPEGYRKDSRPFW